MAAAILGHSLLHPTRRSSGIRRRLIADRGQLHGPCAGICRRRLGALAVDLRIRATILRSSGRRGSSLALALLLGRLPSRFLLFLARLPFSSDLLEL